MAFGKRRIKDAKTGEVTFEDILVDPDQRTAQQKKDDFNRPILAEIAALEAGTLRALRDNARGNGDIPDGQGKTPNQRLDETETAIAALRATLRV